MKKENAMPNFIEMEENVLKLWQDKKTFEKVVKKNENSQKRFRFLDGPITANNIMGIHHAWNRSLKDFMHRFKAMTGHSAQYQNGFDAQGLWVEVEVEKELGLKSKEDIEKLGMAKFTEACIARVDKYSKIITEQSKRLGQWMDWDNSYFTNSDQNIMSIWHFLRECDSRGWLVQKYRPMPWCPHCGTSLSDHEIADSYQDMMHEAVYVKMDIKNTNSSVLVWTTTPWTLPANVAVAVSEELEYSECKVKSSDRTLILSSNLVKSVIKGDLIEVVRTFKGTELVGKEYETAFPTLEEQDFPHKIVAWEMVTSEDGTGAVHIAPGCGAEDFELGSRLDLKNIIPVNDSGIFFENFGIFAGKKTNEVDQVVFDELEKTNKLYYTHSHEHRYPICWRCKTPLIYRLTKEWYLKVDEIRPLMIKACDDVKWQPEFLKKRMIDWLENMGDWNISRKRYYGLPLPIYICEHCNHRTVVGSVEELKSLSSEEEVNNLKRLHRPYIDDIKINCPHCNQKVSRVPEVGDCWLDAGITPFSTKKYFEDEEYFKNNFPSEVVVEMKEQVRLWFYAILFMSVTLEQKAPYEKVIGFAMLVSEDGSKFSKTGKNNIVFQDAADKMGSDVIRYMFAANNMQNDTRFGFGIGDEIRRKLLGLWNAYIFFNTYAVLDKPQLENFVPDYSTLDNSDKWLLARLGEFVYKSTDNYENQQFFVIIKDFEILVDDLTNWYIRINRKRFWKSDDEKDKLNAYHTLYTALKTITQVMAPITPFMSEHIWQNMVKNGFEPENEESIFLSNFPKVELFNVDNDILSQTHLAREVITLAQRLRNESQIKIKQPLKNLYISADNACFIATKNFEDVIKDELNIKNIVYENDRAKFNEEYLIVNFKTAGAVLKGDVQKVKNLLGELSQEEMNQVVKSFKKGSIKLADFEDLSSDLFVLNHKPKQGYLITHENDITLVLDTSIDESLMIEGLYRELVRQIQVLRKESNFKIEDRLFAFFETESETLKEVLSKFKDKIMAEALIKEIAPQAEYDVCREMKVSEEEVKISLKRV